MCARAPSPRDGRPGSNGCQAGAQAERRRGCPPTGGRRAAPLRRRSAPPRAAPRREPRHVTESCDWRGGGARGSPPAAAGAGLASAPPGCPRESAPEPEPEPERDRAGRGGRRPPWTTSRCCRTGRPPTTWRPARATSRAARMATAPSPPRPRRRPTPTSSQGYLPTTPGSTTSTVEMSPGTLPIPSLSLVAAQSAESGFWRTPSPSWAS